MENRFLFRGKRTDTGEWVDGHLITDEKDDSKCFIGYIMGTDEDGTPHDLDVVQVDSTTICQCTGLEDKNGKLIWENDIVTTVYDGIEKIYVVKWDSSELDFKGTNGEDYYGCEFQYLTCCEEVEVIGNMMDTPELLKRTVSILETTERSSHERE